MDSRDYLEVYPDAVIRAGQNTADTASMWQTWSTRIRMSVDQVDKAARSGHISRALADYSERVVPGAARVAGQVVNLGVHTSSGGVAVADGEVESLAALDQPSAAVAEQAGLLRRPVNGWSTVT